MHVESGAPHQGQGNLLPITILSLVSAVSHVILGGVALVAISFANIMTSSTSLKQHIILCVIGYVLLLAPSIHTINIHTSWARRFRYEDRKVVHTALQILGSILALTGGIIRIADAGYINCTAHGIFGIISMVLTTISLIGGVASFNAARISLNPHVMKIFHSVAGCMTLCTAFVAINIGFHEYYRPYFGDTNANMIICCSTVGLLGILMVPSIGIMRSLSKL